MTRAECYIVSFGRTSGHGMDMGGKGGIMAIISSFLLFALRSLEIEPLEKNPEKKCFPTTVCLEAAPPHRSEDRKVSKAAGPGSLLVPDPKHPLYESGEVGDHSFPQLIAIIV